MKRWIRLFFITVPFLLLIGGGVYLFRVSRALGDRGESLVQIWEGIKDPRQKFPADKSRITLLLIGKDYNYTNKDLLYTKGARSDTIMLMSIDLDKKTMSAVSIPRDTHVIAPDKKEGKINGTFSRGGIKLLQSTLEKMFGVKVDYHVVIKDDAVKNIVNTLGGVDVVPLDAMKYDDRWANLHINLPKGPQHVNGEQAVGFVRFREVKRFDLDKNGQKVALRNVVHSLEEGDFRRTARQQEMIKAIIKAANAPGNLLRAPDVIDVSFKQFDTDLSRTQMLALATLFKGTDHQEMLSATLPGKDAHMNWGMVYELDMKRSQATIDWLILGQQARAKDTIKVSVMNGSAINGAARATTLALSRHGFATSNAGNSTTAVSKTTVTYHKAAYEPMAREVAEAIGATTIVKKAVEAQADASEIMVSIGSDFSLKKVAPTKPLAEVRRRSRRNTG